MELEVLAMQMAGTLEDDITTGQDFCKSVIDIAVQAADTAMLLSLVASERLALDVAANLATGSLLTVDTGCNDELRTIQKLLDEHISQQNSSSTVALKAASTSDPDGERLCCYRFECIVSAAPRCFGSVL